MNPVSKASLHIKPEVKKPIKDEFDFDDDLLANKNSKPDIDTKVIKPGYKRGFDDDFDDMGA